MKIIEEIIKFVYEECKKPTSKYGFEPFENHFSSVVKYSLILAEKTGADKEIVEIAAWLHDIGSIIVGRENHHITGAEIAEKKLNELKYPLERIELVKKCILNHRGSILNDKDTKEEKVIADADALSNFDNISGIFMASFLYEHLNQKEAKSAVLKKLINSYNKLSFEESKLIIKPKFDAAVLLFK